MGLGGPGRVGTGCWGGTQGTYGCRGGGRCLESASICRRGGVGVERGVWGALGLRVCEGSVFYVMPSAGV